MVSWKKSRTGHEVPLFDGICLHSLVNPLSEGAKWAASRAPGLEGDEVVFVLGVAGGFHVKALAELMPQSEIVALDLEDTLVNRATSRGLNAWFVSNAESILANPRLVKLLLRPYSVITFGPSYRTAPEIYARLEKFLLARNAEDLRTHAKLRPELKAWIDALRTEDEIITIHSLCRANNAQEPQTANRGRLWYVLRELVV